MILTVKPALEFSGTVQLPASKSYSIRAFLIAACGGRSTIINPSNCDDAVVAMRVAQQLGARIRQEKNSSTSRWNITASEARPRLSTFNVKESGTVLRFLLPLLALRGKKVSINGEGTLRGRPNYFLTQSLRRMGIEIRGKGKQEGIPIHIQGGEWQGGNVEIDGSLSSQFISALLIACPQLHQDTRLSLKGKRLVSSDYITMTCQTLKKSGIQIHKKGLRDYRIKGRQTFRGLKNFTIPSDYGLAAFHMAAAVLNPSDVTLTGFLNSQLIQADGHILNLMKRIAASISSPAIRIDLA